MDVSPLKVYKNKRTGQLTCIISKKKIALLKLKKEKYLKIKLKDLR